MSYTRVRNKKRGNRSGNGVMRVRIFKAQGPAFNELKAAYYAVEAAATELLNTGHINGFHVAAFTTDVRVYPQNDFATLS